MKITNNKNNRIKYPPNAPEEINLQKGSYTFASGTEEDPLLTLESGKKFGSITIAYETYGNLNEKRDNTILICHALTGNAHVAGQNNEEEVGWWDPIIGPGRPIDTNKYFIVCSNIIGGCSGSTGPASIDPETNKPYGMTFPLVTIKDMVNSQKRLLEGKFNIKHLYAVVGGSLGGMQALQWPVLYPDFVDGLIMLASTSKLSAQAIAFNKIGRHAIMIDPKWNKGQYYNDEKLLNGLALARMVAHITYLSDEAMQIKFGREHSNIEEFFEFEENFEVENYLDHQGYKFIKRFDANSYLFLSKAMDLFDISRGFPSLEDALKKLENKKILLMSFTSDWLFPGYQTEEMYNIVKKINPNTSYYEINSYHGHDSFLLEYDKINPIIGEFIENIKK